jgi:hypothetical protein
VQSKALDEAPYKLSGAVAKLAGITFWSLDFSYWFDKPWFLTEGILAAVLITPSLGVPNWSVIYINTAQQSRIDTALACCCWYMPVQSVRSKNTSRQAASSIFYHADAAPFLPSAWQAGRYVLRDW